jgi:RsiW-degrading membrane proteinase PrsW (M82 family)
MFKKITMIIAFIIIVIMGISIIPKQIATPVGTFLIIFGIVMLVLALLIFGFKDTPAKQWWE